MGTARIAKFRTDEITVQEMLWVSEAVGGSVSAGLNLVVARLDPSETLTRDNILGMPMSVYVSLCDEMGRCIPNTKEASAWRIVLDAMDDDDDDEGDEGDDAL